MSEAQLQGLQKLDQAKGIPVKILKAKINQLKVIDFDPKTKYWVFRWFKFTLKPPYRIMHDNLRLAI